MRRSTAGALLAFAWSGALPAHADTIGVIVSATRAPVPWRALDPDEEKVFALGHAVFNTRWAPANEPAGRRDGLGPLFNSAACDACHNSGRRGRGPAVDGEVSAELVIQLGRRLEDGRVERGHHDYGFILNTSALPSFTPEARVTVSYAAEMRTLGDGTAVVLRRPAYEARLRDGARLDDDTVLMPRLPPPIGGVGLLERVPESAVLALADSQDDDGDGISGVAARAAVPYGTLLGRFGWQATEPTVASQTAAAFSREMGLTTGAIGITDCLPARTECGDPAAAGTPEVESELFDALVEFQRLHAVSTQSPSADAAAAESLFAATGCAACHRSSLPVEIEGSHATIAAYTDLLVHDLGEDLADRDVAGHPARSAWRTAPLWGLGAAPASTERELRFLHDGRARSLEEAILWHGGEATQARERFGRLPAADRAVLLEWLSRL